MNKGLGKTEICFKMAGTGMRMCKGDKECVGIFFVLFTDG